MNEKIDESVSICPYCEGRFKAKLINKHILEKECDEHKKQHEKTMKKIKKDLSDKNE